MKSFAVRPFRVTADDAGAVVVTRVVPSSAEAHPLVLEGLEIGSLTRDGEPVPGRLEPPVVDVDEIQQRWSAPGVATIEIRHGFVAGWRSRAVLADLSGTPWTATLRFSVRSGPRHRTWALATGTDGVLAVRPEDDAAALVVRSGPSVAAVRTSGAGSLEVGPYRLAAGERLVTSWEWTSARHPRDIGAQLRSAWPILPWRSTVAVGEEIWLPADPDAALVGPDEVTVESLDERLALGADEPGRHVVEIRSARGATRLELAWTDSVADFLTGIAVRLLAAPAGRSGVVGLPDVTAALVVQRVARTAGFPAATAAADALDQFTARLDARSAFDALYLAGEYDRLGDPDLVERAAAATSRAMAAAASAGRSGLGSAEPGLGLAVVRTALASMLAGGTPIALAPEVAGVAGGAAGDSAITAFADPGTPAELELLLATRPPDLLAADVGVKRALYRLGVGTWAGLPGPLPAEADPGVVGHALAVLRLVPDSLGGWWHHRFGGSVAEFVDSRSLDLVDRLRHGPQQLAPESAATAGAWLALGS